MEEELADVCWICLQSHGGPHGGPHAHLSSSSAANASELILPCACPRPVHKACLARWQLHCAGREEELQCRFCKRPLPHWADALRPQTGEQLVQVAPVMSIQFAGQTFWLNVQMGQGGVEHFKADVRRLLSLSPEDEFDITFECQVPGDGSRLELHGLEAYDAAVYCASLTAAERMGRSAAADGTGAPAAAAAAAPAAATSPVGPADAAAAEQPCVSGPSPAGSSHARLEDAYGDGSSTSSSSSGGSFSSDGGARGHVPAGTTADFMNSHRRPRRHVRTSSGDSGSSSSSSGHSEQAGVARAGPAAGSSPGPLLRQHSRLLQPELPMPLAPSQAAALPDGQAGAQAGGQAGGQAGARRRRRSSGGGGGGSEAGAASSRGGSLSSWLVAAMQSTYRWAAGGT